VEGDAENPDDFKRAAAGVDTVLSVLGGSTLYGGKEKEIVKYAKEAGVKRYIPSEFGCDADEFPYVVYIGDLQCILEIVLEILSYYCSTLFQ
jgi:hypothetical protein